MALTVLRHDRIIEGRDAASVWAQVGDLARIDQWFPVHSVGALGDEAPAVGNVVFVSHRQNVDPAEAVRLRVVEWEAGTRFRCEAAPVPGISDALWDVRVVGEPPDDTAHVYLGFTGDADGMVGRIAAFEISRRFRVALRRLEES